MAKVAATDTYVDIAEKIKSMKRDYPSLRDKPDYYVFSALFIKVAFYKNPTENDFDEIVVDGAGDGGADILLSDPNSETSDLVIGQSKFNKDISHEDVLTALRKMADFYNDMKAEHYEKFNSRVTRRFLKLDAECGDDSKVHFVFYTSAPKKDNIDTDDIEKKFREQFIDSMFIDSNAIEVSILFAGDIKREIDTEAQRFTIKRENIRIDDKDNYLLYGDDAVIVNVSAASIKSLFALHGKNLLALNLRYYIRNTELDKKIRDTIKDNPASFWFKNNGITIICENFRIDGREVHLENFSIVNGGQTTYLISKSKITAANDFYLMCKIIKIAGDLNGEFSLEIAEAANSQKPIKPSDLRVNAPEQRTFAQAMRTVGVHYQTKRGQEVPKEFRLTYLHTKMEEVGKLCLAAIFQEPCKSRNNPALSYKEDKYYTTIFKGNQAQVAQICKELLYMDYYFDKIFQPKFETANKNLPNAAVKIPFANNSRRICVAFATLAARYYKRNITDKDVTDLISDPTSLDVYKMLRNLGDMKTLFPMKFDRDAYDAALDKLFKAIIKAGTQTYDYVRKHKDDSKALTARNFLQNDKNYYLILNEHWDTLRDDITETFFEA